MKIFNKVSFTIFIKETTDFIKETTDFIIGVAAGMFICYFSLNPII